MQQITGGSGGGGALTAPMLVVDLEGEWEKCTVIGGLTRRFMQGSFELAAAVVFADFCDKEQRGGLCRHNTLLEHLFQLHNAHGNK